MKQDRQSLSSIRFVVAFVLCALFVFVGYALFFKYKVIRDQTVVPVSYKQLLLEQVKGPRIIIESGSNGLHAFDPALVESLTGYPTIIVADHAGASLHDKVERLARYGQAGDIVILPLEWNYYHAPDLSENHLKSLMNLGRGYFYSLPWFMQLKRAYNMPLNDIASELLVENEERDTDYFEELEKLRHFHDHRYVKGPAGEVIFGPDIKLLPKDSDCDSYIIPEFAHGPIPFTDHFKHALKRLSQIQERVGLKVILTAPVVVGEDCYGKYGAALEPMVKETEVLCDRLGISHQLDFMRYAMPAGYLLDTHFHVDQAGSEVVTPMIIGDLVDAGWITPKSLENDARVNVQIPKILENLEYQLLCERMPKWRGGPTSVVDGDDRGHLRFPELDWYEEETWGRWAKKPSVAVLFAPDPHVRFEGIYINANYFNGSQETKVFLNGSLIAVQDFSKNHLISLEKELREYLKDEPIAELRFESYGLEVPRSVDGSDDNRALKFGLHSIQLIVEKQ